MKIWFYLTANIKDGVIYTGVTSELKHRIESYKNKKYKNVFTAIGDFY